jgi:hypothetical protein
MKQKNLEKMKYLSSSEKIQGKFFSLEITHKTIRRELMRKTFKKSGRPKKIVCELNLI